MYSTKTPRRPHLYSLATSECILMLFILFLGSILEHVQIILVALLFHYDLCDCMVACKYKIYIMEQTDDPDDEHLDTKKGFLRFNYVLFVFSSPHTLTIMM